MYYSPIQNNWANNGLDFVCNRKATWSVTGTCFGLEKITLSRWFKKVVTIPLRFSKKMVISLEVPCKILYYWSRKNEQIQQKLGGNEPEFVSFCDVWPSSIGIFLKKCTEKQQSLGGKLYLSHSERLLLIPISFYLFWDYKVLESCVPGLLVDSKKLGCSS